MDKNCLLLAGKLSEREWEILQLCYGWWEYTVEKKRKYREFVYPSLSREELLFISRDIYLIGLKKRMSQKPILPEEESLLKKLEGG